MNVVEAWGNGIPKMFREAEEYRLAEPELIDMGSDFRVNLYRKAAVVDQNGVIDPKGHDTKNETNDTKNETNDTKNETNDTKNETNDTKNETNDTKNETNDTKNETNDTKNETNDTKNETNDTKNEINDTKNETLLLKLIQEDPTITQKELKEKMQISLITVKRIMNELQNKGRIQRIGFNRSGKWSILDQKKSSQ